MLSYNTPESEISIPIFLTHPPLKHHSDIFHRRGGFSRDRHAPKGVGVGRDPRRSGVAVPLLILNIDLSPAIFHIIPLLSHFHSEYIESRRAAPAARPD